MEKALLVLSLLIPLGACSRTLETDPLTDAILDIRSKFQHAKVPDMKGFFVSAGTAWRRRSSAASNRRNYREHANLKRLRRIRNR